MILSYGQGIIILPVSFLTSRPQWSSIGRIPGSHWTLSGCPGETTCPGRCSCHGGNSSRVSILKGILSSQFAQTTYLSRLTAQGTKDSKAQIVQQIHCTYRWYNILVSLASNGSAVVLKNNFKFKYWCDITKGNTKNI